MTAKRKTKTEKKANPKKSGRKAIVLNSKMLKMLKLASSAGCTYNEMARHIGIDRDTLRKIRDEQDGVQDAIDAGKAEGNATAKLKLAAVWNVPVSKFKQVHLNALIYSLNNNTEFKTHLEVGDGSTPVPSDLDLTDDEAVKAYLDLIKKPQ